MNINRDIEELVSAGVIPRETADKIRNYYHQKSGQSQNRLLVVFGILGAILVGLGIMLIIAHNWDNFSRTVKTILAFIPLVAGQAICGYTLIKRPDSMAWRESGTAFLFFAVGGSISLVSQIYNIPGNLGSFLLTWMLLCLPLIFVMRSSITSLLFLIGITAYACETGYWTYPATESYLYWLLLLPVLLHYYLLALKRPESNFLIFHHWLIPLSVIVVLGTLAKDTESLMFAGYMSLFGLFYQVGNTLFFRNQKPGNNGFRILGSAGTLILLLVMSFDGVWDSINHQILYFSEVILSPELIALVILTGLATVLLMIQRRRQPLAGLNPMEPVFILFLIIYIISLYWSNAFILVNLLVFAIGVLKVREGAALSHLGILNLGLLIITALIVCRFFDTDLTFVVRGILFVSVGIGFFVANFRILQKRKENG